MCDHCWHKEGVNLAAMHLIEVCCQCGERRELDIPGPDDESAESHGDYRPPEEGDL